MIKDWRIKLKEYQEEKDSNINESFTNEFLNDFLEKAVIAHTPTFAILLKEGRRGSDSMTLYVFYCYCASWQRTTSVYATDYFCRTGLHWGSVKFRQAKNILLKHKIISQKILKDEKGRIIKYFIRIHYLKRPISKK